MGYRKCCADILPSKYGFRFGLSLSESPEARGDSMYRQGWAGGQIHEPTRVRKMQPVVTVPMSS